MPAPDLLAEGLSLAYAEPGGARRTVLALERWALPAGAAVAVTGPSGAGKTSLLYLLAGLERPAAGRVAWGGADLFALGETARDAWRRRHVGFVFQDFHLLPGLSPLANVLLPAGFAGLGPDRALKARAAALLERVGVPPGRARDVATLSRGEQQRVAVARALLFRPPILLADEPTASLDPANGAAVVDLLRGYAAEAGATLIVVSHDPAVLARMGAVLRLAEGRLAA
ncbi:MAG TPA: ATP-binding cassette domain-containing protein [Alphaproteobacteria bacterium]|nr:ATP-binding cassette domain-containing protein [Alphaproteobacteria bacterium]